MAAIALATNAVVATFVELSPAVGVTAVAAAKAGVPVRIGLANGANEVATNAVDAAFVELSPAVGVGTVTVVAPLAVTVPVNVGLAAGAPPTPVTSPRVSVTAPLLVFHDVTPAANEAETKAVVAS